MKKVSWVALIVLLCAAGYWVFNSKNPAMDTLAPAGQNPGLTGIESPTTRPAANNAASASPTATSNAAASASSPVKSEVLAANAGVRPVETNAPPDVPPLIAIENMRRAVRQYNQMFGGDPVGTNPEITKQLNGDNAKHINFINFEDGMRVNANGELVDAWGTPYFFHQISGTEMEIHSAGPDKTMWTADDLIAR